jgi:GNAT superfamily N-acetyltransferase
MQLIAVTTPVLAKEFIQANVELNKGNKAYIRPIDKEINEVFDPGQNKAFRHGEVIRWILKDDEGRLIGRIAAFVNKKYKNKGDDVPVGGVGFFDCINNQEAADMLLDVARHWLSQRGMEAMDGPINFGERDKWWGLLVEGFHEPLWSMNFNPPYYKELLENYGFKPFFHQLCFGLDPMKPLSPKVMQRHAAIEADPRYSARTIEKKRLEKYAMDFVTVYNAAYAGHGGLKEMKKDQALLLFKKMKPLLDEDIAWFAYYDDKPIALFLNIPELNQYYKHFNGKVGPLQMLQFVWLKMVGACKHFTGIIFALHPDFQGKGVDAYIIAESAKIIQPAKFYVHYEMQWIGDFNPKMVNIARTLGETYVSRKLTTYRYLFDRGKEFKRHPMLAQ